MSRDVEAVLVRTDRAVKLERLRDLLERRGAASLALTSREALSWLLDGARVSVPLGGAPVLTAVVAADSATLYVYENELDRLVAEELGDLTGFAVHAVPWFEPLPSAAALAEPDVAADLRALRAQLLPEELARFRALGKDAASAVTRVAAAVRPGDTESAVAAEVVRELVALRAEPAVMLVAGAQRLELRHPLPTDAALGARAMIVVGARRAGLTVSFTRWLGDEPGATDAARRLSEVEADAFAATRAGRRLADVLADIAVSYERHGFAADEWRRHHQGGPTGYAGRDPRATPTAADLVVDGQAFAWNPTAPRQKIEDTVVIAQGRVEVLTADAAWPSEPVRGVLRPRSLPFAS